MWYIKWGHSTSEFEKNMVVFAVVTSLDRIARLTEIEKYIIGQRFKFLRLSELDKSIISDK